MPVGDLVPDILSLYTAASGEPTFNKPDTQWTSVASLTEAYECHLLKDKVSPVFLIVGIDDCFIDDAAWTKPLLSWRIADKGKPHEINSASLMTTVIWPTISKNEVRVSLYTGGDAEEERERHLLSWMENGRDLQKKEVELDVVKMGHHGSHFALPENMVNFQNKAFVVSAGKRHGHPSYSVLIYLLGVADILKRNKIMPCFKILATRKPYWIDLPSDELSRKHFNMGTVMGYNGGTAVIFEALIEVLKFSKHSLKTPEKLQKELNRILKDSVGETMRHMKNVYWIQNNQDLSGLAKIGDGHTFLNQFKEWKPPTQHLIDPDGQYALAVKTARESIQIQWDEHKCETKSSHDDVQFVAVKAHSAGVVFQTIKNGANSIWEKTVQSKGGPRKKKDNKVELENWTIKLFIDDIKAAQCQTGSNFPKIGRFERHALSDDVSDIAFWLNQCFLNAATLQVSGTTDDAEKVVLDTIDIQLCPKLDGVEVASTKPTRLAFATNQIFAELIGFTIPPVVEDILAKVKLRPAPARSSSSADSSKGENSSDEGPDCRSGLWFIPCHNLRIIFWMVMELDLGDNPEKSTSALEEFLGDSGLASSVSEVFFTGTRVFETMLDTHMKTKSMLGIQAKMTINTSKKESGGQVGVASPSPFNGLSVTAGINFTNRGFEVTLQMHDRSGEESATSYPETSAQDTTTGIESALGTILKGFDIRNVIVGFESESDDGSPSKLLMPKPAYFTVNIEARLLGDEKVPILASLRWCKGVYSLSCELWHHSSSLEISSIPISLQPYSDLGNISAMNPRNLTSASPLSIKDLINRQDLVFPAGIPHIISDARFQISFTGDRKTVFLEGGLECPHPTINQPDSLPPVFRFNELHIALTMTFDGKPMTDFILEFDAVTEIGLPPGYKPDHSQGVVDDVISISSKVEYVSERQDSLWTISGKVSNVKLAHLYNLFAKDGSNDAIMDFMAGIHLEYICISYEYHKQLPGKLELDGTLLLGTTKDGVRLRLEYTHMGKAGKSEEKEDGGWFFKANAAAATDKEDPVGNEKTFKIATLLKDLVDDVNDLLEIVRSMEIPRSCLEVNLACSRVTSAETGENHAVFALTITVNTNTKISKFDVTLAQICSYGGSNNKPGPLGPGRLLRFSLSKMKNFDVPVVGNIGPPFDQVGIVWANRDIIPTEIEALNEHVFTHQHLLVQTRSGDTASQGSDSSNKGTISQDGGKSVAPMAKTFGPLSVRNIGLSVSGPNYSTISLSLDAIVQLGPLAFTLLGFTITINLSVINHPDKLASLIPGVIVDGMVVEFDKPPTRIGGMVTQFNNPGISKGFQGAIAVSLSTWSAMAGGRYEELYPDFTTKPFSLFGMIQGPIAEFGCAEINGLTGGFGYNSRLQLSVDASGVANFPFVALNRSSSQGNSAMDQMNLILAGGVKDVVSPAKEEMWFVAGLGIKAFQSLEGQAIFAMTLNDRPKFTVLATATPMFPKPPKGVGSSKKPFRNAFVVVDIALSCVIDPFHGTVIATGELTPVSFILDQECKLTGSFAMAYFLPNSPHDGDFVFSVGGYHPHFRRPSHYPVVRDRVGITWKYDNNLFVSGKAYFAITPHAVMGGGRLDMVFNKSLLGDALSIRAVLSATETKKSIVQNSKGESIMPLLFARPMMLMKPFEKSELMVTLRRNKGESDIALDSNPIMQSMPPALWGEYIENPDVASLQKFTIPHVVGYTLSLHPTSRSLENIPAVSVKEFNSVDVSEEKSHNIQPIKPAVEFADDERFQLASDVTTEAKNDRKENEKKGKKKKKKDAFAAWNQFKRVCSGGGLGKDAQLGKIFTATRRNATEYEV
ncbi:hypothetical protein TARUN_2605 [Trichoderma arundinaceum]|uniref:DUF6603 domain-containing protein n=1 Tax=Trichoderma arundinaceum TaxID=490622 RepID=A0A395NU51_TRIAR|nr:hypothetical protein TARUN_2605 [Trichoderma arundinaceum]